MKYIVKDSLSKIAERIYYTQYHADQMARALNLHEATQYEMYHGSERFVVEVR